jgi:hypothetical protein
MTYSRDESAIVFASCFDPRAPFSHGRSAKLDFNALTDLGNHGRTQRTFQADLKCVISGRDLMERRQFWKAMGQRSVRPSASLGTSLLLTQRSVTRVTRRSSATHLRTSRFHSAPRPTGHRQSAGGIRRSEGCGAAVARCDVPVVANKREGCTMVAGGPPFVNSQHVAAWSDDGVIALVRPTR